MVIHNDLTLGLDLGIASCGWALIRRPDSGDGEIVDMGVWTFDAPETDKERTPTNQLRRQHRGLRRVLRRRRKRMADLRGLFVRYGLLERAGPGALRIAEFDPWALRADGLDRKLKGPELAVVLGHIARHRGFKSNSKRDRGANATDESSKMLKAIGETRDRLAHWRTVGEMFARDTEYAGRKRNRDGQFSRSILRDDQVREVALIFDMQRRMGNPLATEDLESAFAEVAFFQRPLQDSEHLVGDCPFEPSQKRAARRAPSFERFRLLSRLAALRLQAGREEIALNPAQITLVEASFGQQKTISFKTLRNLLGLSADTRFAGVAAEDEKNDFVARSGHAVEGTYSLRKTIVENAGEMVWKALLNTPETLDAIASILTFRDDLGSIRTGLETLGLEPAALAALLAGVEDGRSFSGFKGAGHVSAMACRAILPHLRQGLVYSEACARAGYDHAVRPITGIDDINNPVAKKALSEALKQVKAIVQKHGLPGAIHVELARDVGKSKEERDEIKSGIEKRNKAKDRLREQFLEDVGVAPMARKTCCATNFGANRTVAASTATKPSILTPSSRQIAPLRSIISCLGADPATTVSSTRRCASPR